MMELTNETASVDILELETVINKGNKIYLVKRHFVGKRGLKEAINKIIINEAVRRIK